MPCRGTTLAFRALQKSPCSPCLLQSELYSSRFRLFSTAFPRNSELDVAPITPGLVPQGQPARILPASPSYFTGTPIFTDYELKVQSLQAKYIKLSTVDASEAPRVSWFTREQFRKNIGEDISVSRYERAVKVLKKLIKIRQDLMPQDLQDLLNKFSTPRNLYQWEFTPKVPDENGRAKGMGRRKEASATAFLVEGDGQVLINGKNIMQAFPRIHDRESAVWALRSTGRLDKYNVFVVVRGGGITGQAEATTRAVAKALLVHEPGLKAVLRRAGVIRADPRRVERKKPGKVKARKMPAWVKR